MSTGIYKAMCEVMKEVKASPKTGVMKDWGGYNYRSINDICNALHSVLARCGVFPVPEVLHEETAGNGRQRYVRLQVAYTFYHTDGSSVRCVVHSEALDSSDKATAKAMTMAYKSALTQVFCLATEDDGDKERLPIEDESGEAKPVQPGEAGNSAKPAARPEAYGDMEAAALPEQYGQEEFAARAVENDRAGQRQDNGAAGAMRNLEKAAGKSRRAKKHAFKQSGQSAEEDMPDWLKADDVLAMHAQEEKARASDLGPLREDEISVQGVLRKLKLRYMKATGLEETEARRRMLTLMSNYLRKEIRMNNLTLAELGSFELYLDQLLRERKESILQPNAYMTDEDKDKIAEARTIMRDNDMSEAELFRAFGKYEKKKIVSLQDFTLGELESFGNYMLAYGSDQACLAGI